MSHRRLMGGAGHLINRVAITPSYNRNIDYIEAPSGTQDRCLLAGGPRLPDQLSDTSVNTLANTSGNSIIRSRGSPVPEEWTLFPDAVVPRASLGLSFPQSPSLRPRDNLPSRYIGANSISYHPYRSLSGSSIVNHLTGAHLLPTHVQFPQVSSPQGHPSIELPVDDAHEFLNLIFHAIRKTWVEDWNQKAKQEILRGQKPNERLKEVIDSIQKSADSLPKSFSYRDLHDVQLLLDKIEPEGAVARKVLKECLINYAGNCIESILPVIRNLLVILNHGKKFLGHCEGAQPFPPPQMLSQFVLVYTTKALKNKRAKAARSEDGEEASSASLGYKTSPCKNLKCRYCISEETNGGTGPWRTRQDATSCLMSTLSEDNPWICPACPPGSSHFKTKEILRKHLTKMHDVPTQRMLKGEARSPTDSTSGSSSSPPAITPSDSGPSPGPTGIDTGTVGDTQSKVPEEQPTPVALLEQPSQRRQPTPNPEKASQHRFRPYPTAGQYNQPSSTIPSPSASMPYPSISIYSPSQEYVMTPSLPPSPDYWANPQYIHPSESTDYPSNHDPFRFQEITSWERAFLTEEAPATINPHLLHTFPSETSFE